MGRAAAAEAAQVLQAAIQQNGRASLIAATGASQFCFLEALTHEEVDWPKVAMFHLDEYLGVPASHPASFRRYLKERFASKVPLGSVHYIDADSGEPEEVCRSLGQAIRRHTVDVAFVGIGENGHLAFNDPPADFEADGPYVVVALDKACRRQQVGEGWFAAVEDVPKRAVSVTVREILRANVVLCVCPHKRKARAVRDTLEGPVSPEVPASILRTHRDCRFFLDRASASELRRVP